MTSSPKIPFKSPNPNEEEALSPHSGGVDEGREWDLTPLMNRPDQKGSLSSIRGESMPEFTTGEEFETTPKVKVIYGDHETEVNVPLSLDQLLSIARGWGIRRFVTDPPLTRDDFPINESMTLTLIPRDKEA